MLVEHEPVTGLRDEVGALSPHSLRDEERPSGRGNRCGMELDELHVADVGAGSMRDRDPVARRAGRIRRPRVERARSAGGEERHPRPHRLELVVAEDPRARAAVSVGDESDGGGVLDDTDARIGRHPADERPGDRRSGCRAVGVEDAVAAVAALPGELWPAVLVAIPLHAEPPEVGHAVDALPHEHRCGRRVGQAPPHGEGVGQVKLRVVVGADRCGDAALGHEGVRRLQRALRHEHHARAAGRGLERGVEPCKPCADDQDVGAVRRSFTHGDGHISRSD